MYVNVYFDLRSKCFENNPRITSILNVSLAQNEVILDFQSSTDNTTF